MKSPQNLNQLFSENLALGEASLSETAQGKILETMVLWMRYEGQERAEKTSWERCQWVSEVEHCEATGATE